MKPFVENATVDVVIPVYKPGEEFLKLIWMLEKQTVVPEKIILMITESESAVYPDLSGFDNIEMHFVSENEFDHGKTRNEGVSYALSEYVLLLTQDALPADTHFVETLLAGFESEESIGAAYARQIPRNDANPVEKLTRAFNYPDKSEIKTKSSIPERGIKTYFCSNVACMYDRKIFRSLRGFPENAIFNEDMVFAHKLISNGYAIGYNADAKVIHSHNLTGKEQFRRNFDLGVSQTDFSEIFGSVSSESEGKKLVKYVTKELVKTGKIFYVFPFLYQCGMKYLGYRKGKKYRSLSEKTVRRCSMNKHYWERYYGTDQRGKM